MFNKEIKREKVSKESLEESYTYLGALAIADNYLFKARREAQDLTYFLEVGGILQKIGSLAGFKTSEDFVLFVMKNGVGEVYKEILSDNLYNQLKDKGKYGIDTDENCIFNADTLEILKANDNNRN